MSEMSHAPLPWTAYEREDGWWEIDHAADGGLECRLSKEDIDFIIRAVNCHEDLLEACEAMLAWEASEDSGAREPTPEQADRYMRVMRKVVDAVVKARGTN